MDIILFSLSNINCNLSGAIDPSYLLEQIEVQISKIKEEAFSRKEILEKVEKWLVACEEERWLEEYNRVGHYLYIYIEISFWVLLLKPLFTG